LGKPTSTLNQQWFYVDQTQQPTSKKNLDRFRKQDPQMSDQDFHSNYDNYTRTTEIAIRFSNGRTNYIGILISQVY
jgi:hypothetical protein